MKSQKRAEEIAQQFSLQLLWICLNIICYLVILFYTNLLYFATKIYLILWIFANLSQFILHFLVKTNPGYIEKNTTIIIPVFFISHI